MAITLLPAGGRSSGQSQILVSVTSGSTVYIENQDHLRRYAPEENGVWTFSDCGPGIWTVCATLDNCSASELVAITEEDQRMRYYVTLAYIRIYGISRDITLSSPEWVRTDHAIGMHASASVGTAAGSSDFSACYPWNGIVRETLPAGDVMVKIPKFWFRRWREGTVEHIQIADRETEGFMLHPAFCHAGIPKDCVYIAAYKTNVSSNQVVSKSALAPTCGISRPNIRTYAKNKGAGWGLNDLSVLSAVQMLILVEFASSDAQSSIGRGYCDANGSSGRLVTGSADGVPNLTGRPSGTDGLTDVVWRGIEGLWGNCWEWVDGVNISSAYYVCNDPSKYAENTTSGYTQLSFAPDTAWNNAYITEEGLDTGENSHVFLPAAAGYGSASTYYCDTIWGNTGSRALIHGGGLSESSVCGLFAERFFYEASATYDFICSRLMYIPQEVTA